MYIVFVLDHFPPGRGINDEAFFDLNPTSFPSVPDRRQGVDAETVEYELELTGMRNDLKLIKPSYQAWEGVYGRGEYNRAERDRNPISGADCINSLCHNEGPNNSAGTFSLMTIVGGVVMPRKRGVFRSTKHLQ